MAIRQNRPYSALPAQVGGYTCMEFTVDNVADIANLPTSTKARGGYDPVPWGSICTVIGTGGNSAVYQLNSKDEWVEL